MSLNISISGEEWEERRREVGGEGGGGEEGRAGAGEGSQGARQPQTSWGFHGHQSSGAKMLHLNFFISRTQQKLNLSFWNWWKLN